MTIVWLSWKDVDHPLAGGAEVVAHQLLTRLAASGHTVTLVAAGFPGGAPSITREGYRIIRVGSRATVYLAAAWYYFKNFRGVNRPDVVIDECNTLPFFARFYSGTRTIMMIHMLCREIWFYQLPWYVGWIGYLLEPLYLRLLHGLKVVTVSASTRDDLLRHGFSSRAISIITEGIELSPLLSLTEGVKYDQATMLSLGSVRPMKRTLDQIKAFEQAKNELPTLRLVIAGEASGYYARRVRRDVQASPYASSITIMGRVTRAEKRELMQQSHVIAVTSVKEGWGLIISEAASQGTPAVVYNVDGLRDSVNDHITGIVSPHNTPAALADAVVELLQDSSTYQRLRLAGWQASQRLTFEQTYADFTAALEI